MGTAASHQPSYSYFQPKLIDTSYAIGDVYSKEKVAESRKDWEISTKERPYLKHVKFLSNTWPHLRLLADFMEVSTTPMRWADLKNNPDKREERSRKTNVTRLDYFDSGVAAKTYTTPEALEDVLKEEAQEEDDNKSKLRLFVVEDLSRDVIELLGAYLDIEPAFFREHIVDYTWFNTRDRWADPPNLNVVARRQRWFQLRFVTARYFETTEIFTEGSKEAESFNVLRRPEDDVNNKARMDDKKAVVGITRTRASFWLRSAEESQRKVAVGVLLLDPTIQKGHPLWYGYRNWEATPGIKADRTPVGPPRGSLYNDFIYWAQKPDAFKSRSSPSNNPASNNHIPIQALLHLICAEWLTIADYIKTRIGQIEWEISDPDHFLDKGSGIEVALKKLHIWRRLVPLYREMLTETLQRVFQFPCHTTNLISSGIGMSDVQNSSATDRASALQNPAPAKQGPISAYREDFTRALSYMVEFQQRIDRLTSVVTAIISIDDSRRGRADNRNVARLTWLATFFIPLSFIASLYSMQNDVSQLRETIKLYFATAMPLAVISLGLAFILGLHSVQKFLGGWRKPKHS